MGAFALKATTAIERGFEAFEMVALSILTILDTGGAGCDSMRERDLLIPDSYFNASFGLFLSSFL
jgi:hypothetical protein